MELQRQSSLTAIADCFGITNGEVSRLVAKYRQTGNINDLPRSGRPKVTTEREDKLIVQHCGSHRFNPARQIRDDLQGVIGRVLSQTINNRLLDLNLPSRRLRKKPEQQHRQARLQYARDHVHWNIRRLRNSWGQTRKDFVFTPMTAGYELVAPMTSLQRRLHESIESENGRSIMMWVGFIDD